MQEESVVIPKEKSLTGYFVASEDHFSAMLEHFQIVKITVMLYLLVVEINSRAFCMLSKGMLGKLFISSVLYCVLSFTII